VTKPHKFLQNTVGKLGANALCKAMERTPELSGIVIPRVIFSWINELEFFSGDIPGTNSKLEFKKSDAGYAGNIIIGNAMHEFQNDSVYKVLGAISLALGISDFSYKAKENTLSNLGKNIDLLVKSHMDKASSVSDIRTRASSKTLVKKDVTTGGGGRGMAPRGKPHEPTPPMEPEEPTAIQDPNIGIKRMYVRKSELDTRCPVCSMRFFKNEVFKGCFCFKELAGDVRIIKKAEDNILLEFGSTWDQQGLAALTKCFGDD